MAPDQKRAYVRAMFARIAPRYDLLNRLMTLGRDQTWRLRAAQLAVGSNPSARVLDLATGTGDLILALDQVAPAAQVVGLDLVPEMLAVAKEKTRGARGALLAGDALDLPFAAGTFDAITSAFMLRNVVDLPQAFREMARVTRHGACIAALEITQPRLPFWSALYRFYFYRFIPLLGGALSDQSAYRYLPDSLKRFVSADELAEIMRGAGLREVRYELLNLGTVAIHVGVR